VKAKIAAQFNTIAFIAVFMSSLSWSADSLAECNAIKVLTDIATTLKTEEDCNLIPLEGPDPIEVLKKALENLGIGAGQATGVLTQVISVLGNEVVAKVSDSLTSEDLGVVQAASNLLASANSEIDAVQAVNKYIDGSQTALENAEERFREGKVGDALWHMTADTYTVPSDALGPVVTKNAMLNGIAQGLASSYGGPAGSAAYAAWSTYYQTGGNVDAALRAGMLAYVQKNYTPEQLSKIKLEGVPPELKKAAMTSALAGFAAAANGEKDENVLKAMINSGAASLVQDIREEATDQATKYARAKFETYCATNGTSRCSDVRTMAESMSRLGANKKSTAAKFPTAITADKKWAISWIAEKVQSPELNVPAVVLTYVGPGSAIQNKVELVAELSDSVPSFWIPYTLSGSMEFMGSDVPLPKPGAVLRASKTVRSQSNPAISNSYMGDLKQGEAVVVLEAKLVHDDTAAFPWLRVKRTSATWMPDPQSLVDLQEFTCAINSYGSDDAATWRIEALERLRDVGCSLDDSWAKEGFGPDKHYSSRNGPAWQGFAEQNAVIFYSDDNFPLAKAVAEYLGPDFIAIHGAGLGIRRESYPNFLMIHYRDDTH
jgi:hypothetical protein